MAGLITVRLSRSDAQPWGFRLQGGKDFGTPLLIQKVNGGSLAERAGLQVADAVIKVNGQDVYNLSHKTAQDTIVKGGNSVEVVISRGPGGTWKPSVTPVGSLPTPSPTGSAPSPVTKTSLSYKGPPSSAIGTGHNFSAKPFSQVNGVGSVKSIASKQYNSPVGLYSEQNIAETLSAQTEVLASGVLGVNFMKNEKTYNANNSEVLKMVQESDAEPREPEPVRPASVSFFAAHSHMVGGRAISPRPMTSLAHQLPPPPLDRCPPNMAQVPESPNCSDCSKLIVGGHVPSGVTAAAVPSYGPQSPQPSTLAPLPFHVPTASLSGPKPFGAPAPVAFSAPVPPPMAPVPPPSFPKSLPDQNNSSTSIPQPHTGESKEQIKEIEDIACCLDKSKRMSICSNEVCTLSEKKPALEAMETLMENPSRASPIPFSKGDVVSEAQELVRQSEGVQTSQEENVNITRKTNMEESYVKSHKMYSAEISSASQAPHQVRAASPEMEQIMERRQLYQSYHDTSRLTPNTLAIQHKTLQFERCLTPEVENLMGKPHGNWSPMPAACFVRPISPNQIISFPPDIPPMSAPQPHPRTATPEQFQEARGTVERFLDHSKHVHNEQTASVGRTTHSYLQQIGHAQQVSSQQYTPSYDKIQEFSAFTERGNSGNGNLSTSTSQNPSNLDIPDSCTYQNQQNNGYGKPGNPRKGNPGDGNCYSRKHGNGNPGDHLNGNQSNEKPTVTEPDDAEEKHSRKSSRTDQSQKSSRKTSSVSEEESSRRVFSDFGGPQISSAVNVESVTEGGIQKTSVTKSQKMEYSSCEFESSRKSSIMQDSGNNALNKTSSEEKKSTCGESRKYSESKYSGGDASINEEETVTKSQVEEIIKQELNKVFQMAQTMENTSFGEMYDQKTQQSSSKQYSKQSLESEAIQVMDQSLTKSTTSGYSGKIAFTDEVITKTGKLTTGLTIAPDRSFTPQALESNYPLPYQNIPSDFPLPRSHPEPPPSKPGYIPTSSDRDSPFLQALTIAPDRPYSPLPHATIIETPSFITTPNPQRSSMLEALTTAPSISVHLKGVSSELSVNKSEPSQKYAPRPTTSGFKPITVEIKPLTTYINKNESSDTFNVKSFPPVTDELKSAFKGTSKVQLSSFEESERQQKEISKQTVASSHQKDLSASIIERPITPSGLHAPNLLPYYQQNIGEIPLAHRSNSPVPHQIKAPTITPLGAQSVPHQDERQGSVKAKSEAYTQQIVGLSNQQQQSVQTGQATSSVSYVSSGSVTKAYSYEQEHKSIDAMGYHASPLAGKLPLAGEQTLPKCSSPVLGKLDHTKQMFKPAIPTQLPASAFRSAIAEQANLKQAPPYFVQEKENLKAPWVVVKDTDDEEAADTPSFKLPQPTPSTQPTFKPSVPSVNKRAPAFPEPSKPRVTQPPVAIPDAGPGGAPKAGSTAGTYAPRRGRGILNSAVGAGARVPQCGSCNSQIRGPFITALGKIWCPDHFVCVNANCRRPLQDIGFVEDAQGLYCEYCFEKYLAPSCNKCNAKVKGDCLNAIGKHFHPECFTCAYCGKLFANSPFFLEDALPYCESDWNELFTTKCFSCGFPIEAGDRWVEALSNNYHSQCFNCTMCKKNLEGQSFFAKGGRPFCKTHAR